MFAGRAPLPRWHSASAKGLNGLWAKLPKAAAPDDVSRAIDQVLSRWAKAWSAQNLSAYLSVYSEDYQPPGDTTRAWWISKQRAALKKPKSIAVSVSDLQVSTEGEDRAKADFRDTIGRRVTSTRP